MATITATFTFNPAITPNVSIFKIFIDPARNVHIEYYNQAHFWYWKSFSLDDSNEIYLQFVGPENLDFFSTIKNYVASSEGVEVLNSGGLDLLLSQCQAFSVGDQIDDSYFFPNGAPQNAFYERCLTYKSKWASDGVGFTLYGDAQNGPPDGQGSVVLLFLNDALYGSAYDDVLIGLLGNDSLYGHESNDELYGGYGKDKLYGEIGADTLYGEQGGDSLYGGDGNDYLDGGLGADRMEGGAGSDTYIVDNVNDTIFDSSGTDTVLIPIYLSLILPLTIENCRLTGNADSSISGNSGANWLAGNEGDNRLSGGGGADKLTGGSGDDLLGGGSQQDTLIGGLGSDIFAFGSVNDSPLSAPDRLSDFSEAQGDLIDLSAIDAKSGGTANDAFNYIAGAPTETGLAANGKIWFAGGFLYGSTDTDTAAEFKIQLLGISAAQLSASCFLL